MDDKTLKTYDQFSKEYCEDWLSQDAPAEMQRLVRSYFKAGAKTADIGSGSGRDVDWLNRHGYPCVGYDASRGLLDFAQKRFPDLVFNYALLPELKEIPDEAYHQVLCETVLMHLPAHEQRDSVKNLFRILAKDGVLLLSWRLPFENGEKRDPKGRLYEAVDSQAMAEWALESGARLLDQEQFISSASKKAIQQMLFKKI